MKDRKTLIAVLLSILVVIIAFYVRITPPPEQQESIPTEETVLSGSGEEGGINQTMPALDGEISPISNEDSAAI